MPDARSEHLKIVEDETAKAKSTLVAEDSAKNGTSFVLVSKQENGAEVGDSKQYRPRVTKDALFGIKHNNAEDEVDGLSISPCSSVPAEVRPGLSPEREALNRKVSFSTAPIKVS